MATPATKRSLALVLILACLSVALAAPFVRPRVASLLPPDDDKSLTTYPVLIREPAGPPRVDTGAFDEFGRPISLACATCHLNSKPPNPDARVGHSLSTFHQSLKGKHGDLTCISCHNPADGYQSLRLADGRSVSYSQVMQLCAQCHGPQYRDYLHGAHGGMSGYWDLKRGPRERNNCTHCHNPHAPKYPTVQPARGPGDVKKGDSHER